jgi:hypothetical protein
MTPEALSAVLFFKCPAARSAAAAAVVNGNTAGIAVAMVVVGAVARRTLDVRGRTCVGPAGTVAGSAGRDIGAAGGFCAGVGVFPGNVDGGQTAQAGAVVSAGLYATGKIVHTKGPFLIGWP